MDSLLSATFIVLLALGGCGFLLAADRHRALGLLELGALSLPAGAAGAGAILFTLNALGLTFGRPLVHAVLFGAAIAGALLLAGRFHGRKWGCGRRVLGSIRSAVLRLSPLAWVALFLALYLLSWDVAAAVVYVDINFDTVMYHFPYAGIVYHTGQQPLYASMSMAEEFSFPPALFELYAALWVFKGHVDQLTPQLMTPAFLLCWVAVTVLAVRRILAGGPTAAAFAVFLFVAMYDSATALRGENTDLLPALLCGGAVLLLGTDVKRRERRRIGPAALLLGLSSWVKYPSLLFGLCAAVGWVAVQRVENPDDSGRAWAEGGWLIVGPTAALFPLLARNAFLYGNPVYPGLCRILGGYLATPWTVEYVAGWWQGSGLFYQWAANLCRLLREPVVLLALASTVAAVRKRICGTSLIGACGLLFLFLYLAVLANRTPQPLRFAFPALGVMSWLGATALEQLESAAAPERRGTGAVLLCMLLISQITAAIYSGLIMASARDFDRQAWMVTGDFVQVFVSFWWMTPTLLIGCAVFRMRAAHLLAPLMVLAAGTIAMVVQSPFRQWADDIHLGIAPHPHWSTAPAFSPLASWMQHHLGPNEVIYTYDPRRWTAPCFILSGDSPLLEPIHRPGTTLEQALEVLRRCGVRYVLFWQGLSRAGLNLSLYEVYRTDPFMTRLSDRRYFRLIRSDPQGALYRVVFPGGEEACAPPPWLPGLAAGGPMPESSNR